MIRTAPFLLHHLLVFGPDYEPHGVLLKELVDLPPDDCDSLPVTVTHGDVEPDKQQTLRRFPSRGNHGRKTFAEICQAWLGALVPPVRHILIHSLPGKQHLPDLQEVGQEVVVGDHLGVELPVDGAS